MSGNLWVGLCLCFSHSLFLLSFNETRLKRWQVADHKSREPVHKHSHSHSHSHTLLTLSHLLILFTHISEAHPSNEKQETDSAQLVSVTLFLSLFFSFPCLSLSASPSFPYPTPFFSAHNVCVWLPCLDLKCRSFSSFSLPQERESPSFHFFICIFTVFS